MLRLPHVYYVPYPRRQLTVAISTENTQPTRILSISDWQSPQIDPLDNDHAPLFNLPEPDGPFRSTPSSISEKQHIGAPSNDSKARTTRRHAKKPRQAQLYFSIEFFVS